MDNSKKPVCFAHRGASSLAFDNSIQALEKALALENVRGIEFDVQQTSDGFLVVHHNFALKINGHEEWLYNLTLADIRRVYDNKQLPLFEDVLNLLKSHNKIIDIELKCKGIARKVIDKCKTINVYSSCILTSIYEEINREIKEEDSQVARIYGYPRDRGKNLAMKKWTQPLVKAIVVYMKFNLINKVPMILKMAETPFISLYHKIISKEVVNFLHDKGAYCITAIIDLEKNITDRGASNAIEKLKDLNVDLIKTDHPQLM
ncbi:MAG: glycerophosphodiester phosphodiesterase [Patescibacteria group bacterium]